MSLHGCICDQLQSRHNVLNSNNGFLLDLHHLLSICATSSTFPASARTAAGMCLFFWGPGRGGNWPLRRCSCKICCLSRWGCHCVSKRKCPPPPPHRPVPRKLSRNWVRQHQPGHVFKQIKSKHGQSSLAWQSTISITHVQENTKLVNGCLNHGLHRTACGSPMIATAAVSRPIVVSPVAITLAAIWAINAKHGLVNASVAQHWSSVVSTFMSPLRPWSKTTCL